MAGENECNMKLFLIRWEQCFQFTIDPWDYAICIKL